MLLDFTTFNAYRIKILSLQLIQVDNFVLMKVVCSIVDTKCVGDDFHFGCLLQDICLGPRNSTVYVF